jgi:hypothetical protein
MRGLRPGSALLVLATAVVLATVSAGIWLMGSPGEQRALRLDERRISDLQSIASELDMYWTRHRTLPESLDALRVEPGPASIPTDPVRGEPYRYRPLEGRSYELCAVFGRASRNGLGNVWAHPPGPYCFELEAKE